MNYKNYLSKERVINKTFLYANIAVIDFSKQYLLVALADFSESTQTMIAL
jgi:hypothetical protein